MELGPGAGAPGMACLALCQAPDTPGAASPGRTEGTEPRLSLRPNRLSRTPPRKLEFTRGRLRTAFQLTNSGVCLLEGFILNQHSLYQRIEGVGGLPQTISNQAFGLRIALGIFQRGEAVEQLDDKFAFLWGHLGRLLPP